MSRREKREDIRGFWGLVAAQFLGAFNDNALRWFLIAIAMKELQEERAVAEVMSLATNIFLLPFLLFSMHAGALADHLSKRSVLMGAKGMEVVLMAACMAGFLMGGSFSFILGFLLVALFFMGSQSTYYSPAKFGILPEILPEKLLSWGNGIFELSGMVAIILGSVAGAWFVGVFEGRLYLGPAVFTCAAVLGFAATCFLPRLPAAAPTAPMKFNPLSGLVTHAGKLARNRILLLTLLAVVFIWSMGVLLQLNIALYARENLGLPVHYTAVPMGIVAVGVGLGTLAAGFLSGKTIEIGLVPIGSVGVAAASMCLFLTTGSMLLSLLMVCMLGFFAGLFIVPTHALLQEESPLEDKGGIWAATNFLQTVGMLLAAEVFAVLHGPVALGSPEVFLVCGLGTLLISVGFLFLLPEALGRMTLWFSTRVSCTLEVEGQAHIPTHGPLVFLIGGPPRREGYLLLLGTRRFVRLVLPVAVSRGLLMRSLTRNLRAFRVQGSPTGGEADALVPRVTTALAKGAAVGVFAGGSGRDEGTVNLPREAIAAILRQGGAPVVPVAIDSEGSRVAVSFSPPREAAEVAEELLAPRGR